MTLLEKLTEYIETTLNANSKSVVFDLGYLIERDLNGGFYNVVANQETLQYDKTYYVPSMLQFKGDWNKPLNYENSNQLAKSGTVLLWVSATDKNVTDGKQALFSDVLIALEELEHKFTNLKENGNPPTITANGLTYNLVINSSPLVDNGTISKMSARMRPLLTLSLSVKLGHNIAYGENVKTEIKRYGAIDDDYVEIETSNIDRGVASAVESSQENGEPYAKSGIQTTANSYRLLVYYPYGTAYESQPLAKPLMIELYRRAVDPDYNPDKRYTIKTTYPDFEVVTHYKITGGAPTETKGVELSVLCTFSPYR